MLENVNHPKHYRSKFVSKVECIDVARLLPFSLGNAFKYIWRAGDKGDISKAKEDIEKARWYLDDWWQNECCVINPSAKVVFDTIRGDDSERYNILSNIIYNPLDCITDEAEQKLIAEIEEELKYEEQ